MTVLGEKPCEQGGITDCPVAAKYLNLDRPVGKKLYLPPLPRHRYLHHNGAFADRGKREMDATMFQALEKGRQICE